MQKVFECVIFVSDECGCPNSRGDTGSTRRQITRQIIQMVSSPGYFNENHNFFLNWRSAMEGEGWGGGLKSHRTPDS